MKVGSRKPSLAFIPGSECRATQSDQAAKETCIMRKQFRLIGLPALAVTVLASSLSSPVLAGCGKKDFREDLSVGQAVAIQGNQALRTIRMDALHTVGESLAVLLPPPAPTVAATQPAEEPASPYLRAAR
jgi:hypothetical protein